MKCPFCDYHEDKVIDSRVAQDGDVIRRRRECLYCSKRYTTYEMVEEIPFMVVKKDGSREVFDKQKIISGILKACEKRPVKADDIYGLVNKIEIDIQKEYDKEVESNIVGRYIMNALKKLDQVAYVRFASVYRDFKDINEFMSELKGLLIK